MVLVDYTGIFFYMWQYFWPHTTCNYTAIVVFIVRLCVYDSRCLDIIWLISLSDFYICHSASSCTLYIVRQWQ